MAQASRRPPERGVPNSEPTPPINNACPDRNVQATTNTMVDPRTTTRPILTGHYAFVRTLPIRPLRVLTGDRTEDWQLKITELDDRSFRMRLRSPAGSSWVANEWNASIAVLSLREQLEPLGVFLCCNAIPARRLVDRRDA